MNRWIDLAEKVEIWGLMAIIIGTIAVLAGALFVLIDSGCGVNELPICYVLPGMGLMGIGLVFEIVGVVLYDNGRKQGK